MYGTLQRTQSAFLKMHAEPAAPDAAPVLSQVVDKENLIERTLYMISEVKVSSIHTIPLAHDIYMRTQNSVQRRNLNHVPQIDHCMS